jgi:hypothetical protein
MTPTVRATSWVVYESSVHVKGRRLAVVCEQEEWEAMGPAERLGYVLVHTAVGTEAAAERLARIHLPPDRDRPRSVA